MARKKTITKNQILNAAYDLVVEEGFAHFTARNIAKRMNCSTQPIYLEFESMKALKLAVLDKIENYLREEGLNHTYTGEPLIDLSLSYINLAVEERQLFRAVFVEDYFGTEEMRRFGFELGLERLDKLPAGAEFDPEQKTNIVTGIWIAAAGIAALASAGFIGITRDQMTEILRTVQDYFFKNHDLNSAEMTAEVQQQMTETITEDLPKSV
ncbi:transcriptional regulator [Lactobacillus selangorensis]|uniref:Transcriptional regulator n=1 Tax=Lactobacillus selangorensis TaxID=81857 RepID=A0A0R2FI66_9LACO|nr:TetR/AcrR family transcriptional regulator [Lactobacillus selangorensis]KRN28335.1 transcriptional regulator [Lactobacillus selangorensis]KRN31837.1 transcriptional regulator [Lactobacillus selangorensis]